MQLDAVRKRQMSALRMRNFVKTPPITLFRVRIASCRIQEGLSHAARAGWGGGVVFHMEEKS